MHFKLRLIGMTSAPVLEARGYKRASVEAVVSHCSGGVRRGAGLKKKMDLG
jgi:hypothetical protein